MFGLGIKEMKRVTSLISEINEKGWESVLSKELLIDDRESCLVYKDSDGKAQVKFYTVNIKDYLDNQQKKIESLQEQLKALKNG